MDRFFLVHKKPGLTSSQVVQKLKHKLNLSKLGHTGTLDKFAEGLLILPSGKACSFAGLFLEMDKTYQVTLNLGIATDSGDTEGEILNQVNEDEIHRVWKEDWKDGQLLQDSILSLNDQTEQTAPMVSALKFQGKRLSDYHRSGVVVAPKVRPIRVDRVAILEFQLDSVVFDIRVSSGTYIRKMAMDIGEKLGFPISLKKLVRLSVGDFELKKAKTWEDISPEDGISIPQAMNLPKITVGEEHKPWIRSGRSPELEGIQNLEGDFLLLDSLGNCLAWCRKKNHMDWQYIRVFL
ncbi:MAG: tRNA pseudouridine(55) synthase TruB [Leptospira sp.]|nr:tRNA pseudouridine(55) synthase TruB [Leptospira sp.]